MGSANKKKNKTIKLTAALRVNRNRSPNSRALDAVRKAKKVHKKPTKQWAKHPGRSDTRGIDDGSRRAKARNANPIKAFFGRIGRRGAHHTNAKRAHIELQNRTEQIKKIKQELQKTNTPEREQDLHQKLDRNKKIAIRQQQIAAQWNEPL